MKTTSKRFFGSLKRRRSPADNAPAQASAGAEGPSAQGALEQQQLLALGRAVVEALQKDGVQQRDVIEQVLGVLQEQKVSGRALAELLAARIVQLAAGPVTAEAAREHVLEGIEAGKFIVPALPEAYTTATLINRAEACGGVKAYLKQVLTKSCKSKEGKFPLLGCSGMKGIGKTAVLMHGVAVLVPQLAEAENLPIAAVYVTFSGGTANKQVFEDSLARSGSHKKFADAFGHMLLACCGVDPDVAMRLRFSDCLSLVKSIRHLPENGTLVLFVDEVGDLGDLTTGTVSAIMAEVDRQDGKLACMFAHIQQKVLNEQQLASKRKVIPLPLPALPIDTWHTLCPQLEKAAAEHPGLHQLLLSCSGHPRSLVEGIPAALQEVPNLLTDPTEEALIHARSAIITESKFNDITDSYMETAAPKWFDFIDPMYTEQLTSDGLLIILKGQCEVPPVELLHPLILHSWAQRRCTTSAIAYHLQQAYAADRVVGRCAEKKMEDIMYHYEAVLRKSVEGKVFPLQQLYQSAHIGPAFCRRRVRAMVPEGTRLVEYVRNFSDMGEVLPLLEEGFIVVSEAHGEVGIEYLSPYTDVRTGKLIVAMVQCKFVARQTAWVKIQAGMAQARDKLVAKGVQHFPVVYTTVDQQRIDTSTYEDGVYFIESGLFDFTKKLGILRLHCEKLGQQMEHKYPWLRGAGSMPQAAAP